MDHNFNIKYILKLDLLQSNITILLSNMINHILHINFFFNKTTLKYLLYF